MKKLLIVLFLVGVSLPSFSQLKEKDVLGTWSYKVETDMEDLSGTFKIEKKEGELSGDIFNEGESLSMIKVEIREGNILYLEIQPDYDVLKISLTIDGKKYQGMIDANGENIPISGEKVE